MWDEFQTLNTPVVISTLKFHHHSLNTAVNTLFTIGVCMRYLAAILLFPMTVFAQVCEVPVGSFGVDGNFPGALNKFANHATAELHYFHCALHNEQLQGALDYCIGLLPPALPEEPVPATGCTSLDSFKDGSGGMVWKPVADANKIKGGAPVFLLKSSEANRVSARAAILSKDGVEVAYGKFRANTNGNRPTYDVSLKASDLDAHSPITVRYERDGAIVCRVVEKASGRED